MAATNNLIVAYEHNRLFKCGEVCDACRCIKYSCCIDYCKPAHFEELKDYWIYEIRENGPSKEFLFVISYTNKQTAESFINTFVKDLYFSCPAVSHNSNLICGIFFLIVIVFLELHTHHS